MSRGITQVFRFARLLMLSSLCLVLLCEEQARALMPHTIALGGGGRAGIGKESLFSNPAGVALLQQNTAFIGYSKSALPDLGAGGRVQIAGVYDGTSAFGRGGISYIRESRRRATEGRSPYIDKTNIRTVFGRQVIGNLLAGAKVNYTMDRANGLKSDYVYGDFGLIYPIFKDLPLGLVLENVLDRAGEKPRTLAAGVRYDILGPLQVNLDYGRVLSPNQKGEQEWSAAGELTVFTELVLRYAHFYDGINEKRGWSAGAAWNSPRTAFEYAYRETRYAPRERDHVFGISVLF